MKLEEMDQDAIRDKKYDFPMMNKNELDQILKSKVTNKKKSKLLLTQIGYLRINLFSECYERIKQTQVNKELDKAVKIMDKCAETVAIPFFKRKTESKWIKRLRKQLSIKGSPEPTELIQNWKTAYEGWFKQNELSHPRTVDEKQIEEFDKLKTAFFTLYTYSFSVENFPPLRNKRSDH